jgi:hypothetical protein
MLVRIPASTVKLKTTINSHAVIERLEYSVMPVFVRWKREQHFVFDGSFEGNYFTIRARLIESNNEEVFPPDSFFVTILFFTFRLLTVETSPVFYGRVFDDGDAGSTIEGHFGVPAPFLCLISILVLGIVSAIIPGSMGFLPEFSMLMIFVSIFKIPEFITERNGIIDFLKGLFFDVIRIF